MKKIRYIDLKEICAIHRNQIISYGGLLGIRDLNALKSTINEPKATFDKIDLYKTIFDKAAIILLSIIKSHPFVDGNKRVGITSALLFLAINGYKLKMDPEKLYVLTIKVATSKTDLESISKEFKKFSIKI